MTAALYARVSTGQQTTDNQLAELRRYAEARGWSAVEYCDEISGAKTSRPALDRLMDDARARRIDVIVVWKLDRWGRSLAHLVSSLQDLDSMGVRFICITQGIDTDKSNPMTRMLLHLLGVFAEFERDLIRERTKAGLARAKANGVKLGGFRKAKIYDRQKVVDMKRDGKTYDEICAALNLSRGAVLRTLGKAGMVRSRPNTKPRTV